LASFEPQFFFVIMVVSSTSYNGILSLKTL
jgi:hypothetical protein